MPASNLIRHRWVAFCIFRVSSYEFDGACDSGVDAWVGVTGALEAPRDDPDEGRIQTPTQYRQGT
jgi:hypothetical protein